MHSAVYPGTFDPITFGHLDVIKRASKLFDKIIIAIATNPAKIPFFSLNERLLLVKACTKNLRNVSVESFDSLLVSFLRKKNCFTVIKGLRELSDFQDEFQQAMLNRELEPRVESIFIMTAKEYFYLSSSMVREIALLQGSVKKFVPPIVEKALKKKVKQLKSGR